MLYVVRVYLIQEDKQRAHSMNDKTSQNLASYHYLKRQAPRLKRYTIAHVEYFKNQS